MSPDAVVGYQRIYCSPVRALFLPLCLPPEPAHGLDQVILCYIGLVLVHVHNPVIISVFSSAPILDVGSMLVHVFLFVLIFAFWFANLFATVLVLLLSNASDTVYASTLVPVPIPLVCSYTFSCICYCNFFSCASICLNLRLLLCRLLNLLLFLFFTCSSSC